MLTTLAAGRVYSFSHAVGGAASTGNGLHLPLALALAEEGIVYVVNRGGEASFGSRVNKVSIWPPREEEVLCEFARFGEDDGQLIWPSSVALDRQRNVYVSTDWFHRISVFDNEGNFLYKWGTQGVGDGELNRPSGMVFDREDHLYIVDSANNRVQKFTKDGTFLAKFGEYGNRESQFNLPWGITIDNQDDIYVADWKNHRVQKFSPDGTFLTSFGAFGAGVGELDHPSDMAIDDEGDVYICDWGNHRVQVFASDGEFITSIIGDAQQPSKWAQQFLDVNQDMAKARRRVKSLELEWRFSHPVAIEFDPTGRRLIVADCQRSRLQIYIKEKDYVDPQFNL